MLQALDLENTVGEVLQFGGRHAADTLFCPIRQRTKASFDLHADDLDLAFEEPAFVLASRTLWCRISSSIGISRRLPTV